MATKVVTALVDSSRVVIRTNGAGLICSFTIVDDNGGARTVEVDPVAVLGAPTAAQLKTVMGQLYTAALAGAGFA
jgi:hypothetical protein